MAECREYIGLSNNGNVERFSATPIDLESCGVETNDAVFLTPSEYVELVSSSGNDLSSLFETYFAFDTDMFLQLQGWFLVTFVAASAVGYTLKILGLSNNNGN